MIVYGVSFVRKVLAHANKKGIPVERRTARPGEPPDADFKAASPFGKIPAFKDGDFFDRGFERDHLQGLHRGRAEDVGGGVRGSRRRITVCAQRR
jgi:glutathione S-transferase